MMTDSEREFRNLFSVVIELPVQWGEMDAWSHVNNVVYLRWFESARIAYLDRIGAMAKMKELKIAPILASNAVQYLAPVEFPDAVLIGASTLQLQLGSSSLTHRYAVFSRQKQMVTTTGEARLVMFDFGKQSKVSIPDDICANIERLEAEQKPSSIC